MANPHLTQDPDLARTDPIWGEDARYMQAATGWQASAGLITDGASIPRWAQPFVGGAWDKQFIRAAVIHDWYCIRTVRARRATHRMFYDALIESNVSRANALTMYYAVLVGIFACSLERRPRRPKICRHHCV